MFQTSECTRINTEGGECCLVGWNTVGMKYISCGSTLTATTCAVSHPKSSVLMELCLETHCFCHHTSQLCFPNTIQAFPLMSPLGKKKIQLEAPGQLRETLPNPASCDFHLQLNEGIPRASDSVVLFMWCELGRLPVKQRPTSVLKYVHLSLTTRAKRRDNAANFCQFSFEFDSVSTTSSI